ncbi:Serine protease, partial [Candidatus Magnetomorum sp. HK-1]
WDNCAETPINSCVDNKGCSCAKTLIEKNDSVSNKKWKTYYYKIEASYSKVIVKIENLNKDVDLYVKKLKKPDFENFDCRPYKGGIREEVCELTNNSETLWYFCVYGYNSGTYSISVTAKR